MTVKELREEAKEILDGPKITHSMLKDDLVEIVAKERKRREVLFKKL